ncbi:MAG: hypothetical protein GY822_02425 [Deltaproteobacteria bacterium]|nr:hypothetical protein [Deltaproteobacteria bacterium]
MSFSAKALSRLSFSTVLLCLALPTLGACGRANMRLVEVEYASGSVAQVTYNNDGTPEEIETVDSDGSFSNRLEFTWSEGKLAEVQILDDNTATFTLEYRYDDQGRVTQANADRDGQVIKIEYEYDSDNANLLDQLDVDVDIGGGVLNHQRTEYRYNEGKVSDVDHQTDATFPIFGTTTTNFSDELDWDGNELERITREGGDTDVFRYSYNDDGSLDEVDTGDDGYQLGYDDRGRIDDVEFQKSNGDRESTEYKYEDGASTGIHFTPGIPYGEYFDLAGRPFGNVEVNTIANLIAYSGL